MPVVHPDRLAATLVCAGGIVGLIGMTLIAFGLPFGFPFGYLGEISFALVLLLGIVLFSKHPVGRVVAAGSVWVAVFGGAVSIAFFLLGLMFPLGSLAAVSALGVVGMVIAVAGALVNLRAPS